MPPITLRDLAQALGAELVGGPADAEVRGITGLDNAAPGCIVYVEHARRLAAAEQTPALALIVPPEVASAAKPLLRTRNPRLAYARAIALLHPEPRLLPGVHPSAQLGADVTLGQQVAVGPCAVVGDGARLSDGVQVHALAFIGPGVQVGEHSVIHPNVTIHEGVTIGARCVIHAGAVIGSQGFGYAHDGEQHVHIPHIGRVVIEDDVEIGACSAVDRATSGATVVGRGTKIDNLVQVAHNVRIGRHCLLAGQVGISGSVTLGDSVILGGQVGIADHLHIGDRAMAAASSGLTHDLPNGAVVFGTPARPRGEQLRIEAAQARLPSLLRQVRDLEARLADLERRLR